MVLVNTFYVEKLSGGIILLDASHPTEDRGRKTGYISVIDYLFGGEHDTFNA